MNVLKMLTGELLFSYFRGVRMQILWQVCQEAEGEKGIRAALAWCWLMRCLEGELCQESLIKAPRPESCRGVPHAWHEARKESD